MCIRIRVPNKYLSNTSFLDPEGSGGANDPSSQTQAALDNKHNMEQREQYYATVRKPGQQSPCREVSALERIPEYSEDIYPYATFNLPEQENLSANPMRQAFFYERSETMLQGAQVRFFLTTIHLTIPPRNYITFVTSDLLKNSPTLATVRIKSPPLSNLVNKVTMQ